MTQDHGDDDGSRSTNNLISLNVSDLLGLGKAAEKLSPAATKIVEGLGKLFDPGLNAAKIYLETRAAGAAERHETLQNLKQISAVDKILASNPELAEAMKLRLISTEMRRQANISATAHRAIEIASGIVTDSPTDIDEDFIQEWIDGVKDISNEQVQNVWATLLAAAPQLRLGRVSKPALELLKQFDQPTAACFLEFAKLWAAVGFPSVKAPSNWAPFGTPVRMKLLSELGVLEQQTFSTMSVPYLGYVRQTKEQRKPSKFISLNTMEVFRVGTACNGALRSHLRGTVRDR